MANRQNWLANELHAIGTAGLLRGRRVVTRLPCGRCRIGDRELIDFSQNDYLGLANDPQIVQAAQQTLELAGAGAGASPLITGRSPAYATLEAKITEFKKSEAAILFPTGFAANLGTLSALIDPGDIVFCDRLNHASLIDGCRLSRAKLRVYHHDKLERLDRHLEKSNDYPRRWIITDTVFSMDGHLAPLVELCNLADKHDAILVVDEAHATGLLGENGRGAAELLGVEKRIDVSIGTLSKAIGGLGGFVAGSQPLVEYLWNTARTQIYSTALPPAICSAMVVAFDIVHSEPERRQHVLTLTQRLQSSLIKSRFHVPQPIQAAIVPVILNDPRAALDLAERLELEGFAVGAIRPPTVPQGTSRLRITLSAAHTIEDVDQLVQTLCHLASR